MRDILQLNAFLRDSSNLWIIGEKDGRVVCSVVYETDPDHRVARAFGGAVLPEFRGAGLLEKAMILAQALLSNGHVGVEVIYATTRTSTPAPQIVTRHLGYKQLGIFPNVHRTDKFETHCLTALYTKRALVDRFTKFGLHPGVAKLFEIVRSECDLPPQPAATAEELALDAFDKTIDLELITAERYALHRFESQKTLGMLQAHFYPFHSPNMVISSPCQTVELFVYTAGADKYCTIIGIKKPREYDFTKLLEQATTLLQSAGVRYIEILVRVDKVKTIERVLQARFIPCAYFPAFQLHNRQRYDFVVCSRTFEIVDFRHLRLAGLNRVYMDEYLSMLQDYFLRPQLSGGEPVSGT